MNLIDGPRLADFLDKYRKQSIPRKDVRDIEQLKKLGIKIARKPKKELPIQKILEAFLLRTSLYEIDSNNPKNLSPYLITNNWSDYAKSWRIKIDDLELHVPFRGKIAFLCSNESSKEWVCHPESSTCIEKIFIDLGKLTLPHLFGKEPTFKAEICKQILTNFRLPLLTPKIIEEIKEKTRTLEKPRGIDPYPFLTALTVLGLASKKDENYLLSGDGLFLTEIEKIQGSTDIEKAAKLLLRKDQQYYMHIITVLGRLESMERKKVEPYWRPVGKGKEEEQQFEDIIEECSLNIRVVANVVREYSQFGAFIEWYPREYLDPRTFRWSRQYYCFLSCCMDSLGFLSAFFVNSNASRQLFDTELKRKKFERHAEYLLRFIGKDDFVSLVQGRKFNVLKEKLINSDFIDFNIDPNVLNSLERSSVDEALCPYNIFLVSKVPVKSSLFKNEVIQTLKNEQIFRDPQGHFYYPDFRFLMSSKFGFSFKGFDNFLAYEMQNDIDFRSRLWLPVLFGVRIKKHKVEDTLLSVAGEPFDSISLRY